MSKAITMSDIAKKLNVSNVTVSKALADKDGVSKEMKAKIKQTATELGYRYNLAAKTLKDGYTHNVGIIIPERFVKVGMSFYWELYKKVANELMKLDYYAFVETVKYSDELNAAVPKTISSNKVDGVIILGQVNKKYFEMIKKQYIPVVFMDFYEKDTAVDFVVTDNFYSMYLLTDYLIEMGHRDIGFIGNIKATSSIQDRFLGYTKALIENDIDFDRCRQWYISDRDMSGKLYDYELPSKLPTAYVCNCDEVAYSLIKKLNSSGYNVPEDVSIVGFDNYIVSNVCEPEITTVEVDMKSMAQTSVDILMRRINNVKFKYGINQISGKIIFKNSVKNINK